MQDFDWDTSRLADQSGRVVLVTGATSGLGLEVARALIAAGTTVIAGVRDLAKAGKVASTIAPAGTPGRLDIRRVDLADLGSVRTLAEELTRDGVVLDALVNNAGLSAGGFALSADGTELTYATNVIGPAVLSELLLPRLTGADPRIVLVGSGLAQRPGTAPDLDAVNDPAQFNQFKAYARSKVAAAAYFVDLGERLAAAGSPVRSVIAHPGVAWTAMNSQATTPLTRLVAAGIHAVARTPQDGARSIVWSATSPDIEQRVYVGPGLRRSNPLLRVEPVRGAAADAGFREVVRAFVAQRGAVPIG